MRETRESEDFMKLAEDLHRLMDSQRTLLLATVSHEGRPDISYAPFVRDRRGRFYIFVSELAAHTANLRHNPKASAMLIRPEAESSNPFARERATFQCRVREIAPNEENYSQQLDLLQEQFGQTVALLRSLPDFHLFELSPESGRYIAGFGRAFGISIEDGSVSPFDR
jgi:putative heme iron utilization protein